LQKPWHIRDTLRQETFSLSVGSAASCISPGVSTVEANDICQEFNLLGSEIAMGAIPIWRIGMSSVNERTLSFRFVAVLPCQKTKACREELPQEQMEPMETTIHDASPPPHPHHMEEILPDFKVPRRAYPAEFAMTKPARPFSISAALKDLNPKIVALSTLGGEKNEPWIILSFPNPGVHVKGGFRHPDVELFHALVYSSSMCSLGEYIRRGQ